MRTFNQNYETPNFTIKKSNLNSRIPSGLNISDCSFGYNKSKKKFKIGDKPFLNKFMILQKLNNNNNSGYDMTSDKTLNSYLDPNQQNNKVGVTLKNKSVRESIDGGYVDNINKFLSTKIDPFKNAPANKSPVLKTRNNKSNDFGNKKSSDLFNYSRINLQKSSKVSSSFFYPKYSSPNSKLTFSSVECIKKVESNNVYQTGLSIKKKLFEEMIESSLNLDSQRSDMYDYKNKNEKEVIQDLYTEIKTKKNANFPYVKGKRIKFMPIIKGPVIFEINPKISFPFILKDKQLTGSIYDFNQGRFEKILNQRLDKNKTNKLII